MKTYEYVLREEEKIIYALRALYSHYGYSSFRMSHFEEYDLYARNLNFMVSDDVITFTDSNGKLMALKPDVTLSIVRNVRGTDTRKLYYNENVYRKSRRTGEFSEMMQVGLECIGNVDDYLITEVLTLAAKSLQCISETAVLNISHMGLIASAVDALNMSEDVRGEVLGYISEKNRHELIALCGREGADMEAAEKLAALTMTYGSPDDVIPKLAEMGFAKEYIEQLRRITEAMSCSGVKIGINLDFSVVNDLAYYNGIVFKGFVSGVPSDVLSGGQYDMLMKKMGKTAGAIGFAVYMDALDRLFEEDTQYDVDTVLLYTQDTSIKELTGAMNALTASGLSVTALKEIPDKLRYKQIIRIGEVG